MVNNIFNEIEKYQEEKEILNKKYKDIVSKFDSLETDILKNVKSMSLDESLAFIEEYKYFMSDSLRKEILELIDSKKESARYYPILNKLKEEGFSNKKIVKLDEFINKYLNPSYSKKKNSICFKAMGFINLLSRKDQEKVIKLLIEENLAEPIYRYYCPTCLSEDDYVINITKDIISIYKEFIQVKKDIKANNENSCLNDLYILHDKLENELDDRNVLICPNCGEYLDIEKIIKVYEQLEYKDINSIRLTDNF